MREGPLHSLIRLISGNQAAQYGLLTLIGPSGKTGCPSMVTKSRNVPHSEPAPSVGKEEPVELRS